MAAKVTWIFLLVMAYWAYCLFWGIKGASRARSAEDYFVAGRRMPFWVFVLAATAASLPGAAFLGHAGLTYADGLPYAYASLYAIAIPFTGVLFLKRQWILGRQLGFVTPGEMLAAYFDSKLIRLLVVVVALVFSVPYLGLQLRASGFLFNVLTDNVLGVEFGTWVLAIVVVSYVATGGLGTAANVATLQAVLLTTGIVVVGSFTLAFVGGWTRLTEGIATLSLNDPVRTPAGHSHLVAVPGVIQWVSDGTAAVGGPWTGMMILTYLLGLMGIQSSPAFSIWAFASRSPAAFAPQQVWASSCVVGLILVVFTVIQGLGSHLLGADQPFMVRHPELTNPVLLQGLGTFDLMLAEGRQDILVPELINLVDRVAPWLVGLLTVCALAAMESTASCHMMAAGGILTRDLFRAFVMPEADDRTQKFVGRLSIVAVVVLALIVATTTTDALVLLGGLAVSYGLQMWPALIAVCYWPFLTRQGVTSGLIVGLVVVTLTDDLGQRWLGITSWGRWPLTIHAAGWGLMANLGTAILISAVTRDDRGRKREFHRILREHAAVPPGKRRLVPLAWTLALLWFVFAIGPGVVIGNTAFGDPNDPATWWLRVPSIWWWQGLGWALGVALMWFLAYHLELATAPRRTGRAGAPARVVAGSHAQADGPSEPIA
jgi:Na+/proline symporter